MICSVSKPSRITLVELSTPEYHLTRVTKSYLLALGTTQKSSFFTKFLTHQTGNYPVTCFVSKPSRITLVELSIIDSSYQKLPFGSKRRHFSLAGNWTRVSSSRNYDKILLIQHKAKAHQAEYPVLYIFASRTHAYIRSIYMRIAGCTSVAKRNNKVHTNIFYSILNFIVKDSYTVVI